MVNFLTASSSVSAGKRKLSDGEALAPSKRCVSLQTNPQSNEPSLESLDLSEDEYSSSSESSITSDPWADEEEFMGFSDSDLGDEYMVDESERIVPEVTPFTLTDGSEGFKFVCQQFDNIVPQPIRFSRERTTDVFRGHQQHAINTVQNNTSIRNWLFKHPTGSGKTYLIKHFIHKHCKTATVILAPTQELCYQLVDQISKVKRVVCIPFYHGQDRHGSYKSTAKARYDDAITNRSKVVFIVCNASFLKGENKTNLLFSDFINSEFGPNPPSIDTWVIDEAHHFSEKESEVQSCINLTSTVKKPPKIFSFSATPTKFQLKEGHRFYRGIHMYPMVSAIDQLVVKDFDMNALFMPSEPISPIDYYGLLVSNLLYQIKNNRSKRILLFFPWCQELKSSNYFYYVIDTFMKFCKKHYPNLFKSIRAIYDESDDSKKDILEWFNKRPCYLEKDICLSDGANRPVDGYKPGPDLLYSDSNIRIMLACQSISEGIDIKAVDSLYVLDQSPNSTRFIQRIGRALRRRIDDLSPFRNKVSVFLVVLLAIDQLQEFIRCGLGEDGNPNKYIDAKRNFVSQYIKNRQLTPIAENGPSSSNQEQANKKFGEVIKGSPFEFLSLLGVLLRETVDCQWAIDLSSRLRNIPIRIAQSDGQQQQTETTTATAQEPQGVLSPFESTGANNIRDPFEENDRMDIEEGCDADSDDFGDVSEEETDEDAELNNEECVQAVDTRNEIPRRLEMKRYIKFDMIDYGYEFCFEDSVADSLRNNEISVSFGLKKRNAFSLEDRMNEFEYFQRNKLPIKSFYKPLSDLEKRNNSLALYVIKKFKRIESLPEKERHCIQQIANYMGYKPKPKPKPTLELRMKEFQFFQRNKLPIKLFKKPLNDLKKRSNSLALYVIQKFKRLDTLPLNEKTFVQQIANYMGYKPNPIPTLEERMEEFEYFRSHNLPIKTIRKPSNDLEKRSNSLALYVIQKFKRIESLPVTEKTFVQQVMEYMGYKPIPSLQERMEEFEYFRTHKLPIKAYSKPSSDLEKRSNSLAWYFIQKFKRLDTLPLNEKTFVQQVAEYMKYKANPSLGERMQEFEYFQRNELPIKSFKKPSNDLEKRSSSLSKYVKANLKRIESLPENERIFVEQVAEYMKYKANPTLEERMEEFEYFQRNKLPIKTIKKPSNDLEKRSKSLAIYVFTKFKRINTLPHEEKAFIENVAQYMGYKPNPIPTLEDRMNVFEYFQRNKLPIKTIKKPSNDLEKRSKSLYNYVKANLKRIESLPDKERVFIEQAADYMNLQTKLEEN